MSHDQQPMSRRENQITEAGEQPALHSPGKTSTMALTLTLLIIASALTVTGEVLLKLGIDHLGGFSLTPSGLIRTFTDWRVFFGFVLVFGGALFWLGVISRVDLSFAYPLLAFNYVIIMIPSHFLLRETITPTKIIGALIVVAGVVVITWGQGKG